MSRLNRFPTRNVREAEAVKVNVPGPIIESRAAVPHCPYTRSGETHPALRKCAAGSCIQRCICTVRSHQFQLFRYRSPIRDKRGFPASRCLRRWSRLAVHSFSSARPRHPPINVPPPSPMPRGVLHRHIDQVSLIEGGKSALAAQIQPVLRNLRRTRSLARRASRNRALPTKQSIVVDRLRVGILQRRRKTTAQPAPQLRAA